MGVVDQGNGEKYLLNSILPPFSAKVNVFLKPPSEIKPSTREHIRLCLSLHSTTLDNRGKKSDQNDQGL